MALQDALEKIGEYNAAIELPNSGLLGIGAFLAKPRATEVAESELSSFIELSIEAEKVLAEDEIELRKNIYLYSALKDIFHTDEDRKIFVTFLTEVRSAFELLLKHLAGESVTQIPGEQRLDELSTYLRGLADSIRQAIPRDTYLASLAGRTHTGFGTGQ
jgi:hypothetical protein